MFEHPIGIDTEDRSNGCWKFSFDITGKIHFNM